MNRSNRRNRNEIPAETANETADTPSPTTHATSKRNTDKTLKLMYGVACFANLIINLDHGIIPACTQELMADIGINELNLGTLGSVVYVGLLIGSISSGPLLQSYSSKKIIAGSTLGNILSVLIFPLTKNFMLLCVSRCLVGFFQVFLVIYFPVWVDLHGKERKTMWITFLQIGVAFGVVLGYVLTAVSVKFFTWRYPFYTQILLLIPCFIAFCLFDEDLMSTNSKNIKEAALASEEEEGHERYLLTISHSGSFFGNEVRDYILGGETKQNAKQEGLEVGGGDEDENIADKLSYVDYIRILWNKKVYIYTMLAISSLYFVITGIQFWISDYMRTVLRQEKGTVFVAFASISTIGPVLGVAVGGKLMDRLGGYTSKQALDFCLACGVMASLASMPVPFLNNFTVICSLLFILLFFGGALMPAVIGIMLSSIPKKMKAIGYSTAYIVQNFLGYVPAPLAYGTVMRLTGGEESRFGMVLLMAWSTLGVFALFAAKNARIQKHMDYMKMQYVEIGEEDVHRPDLFEPKPKNIELKALVTGAFDEEDEYDANAPKTVRHNRTRTFIPPDVLVKRRSTVYKPGRVEKELEALGQSTVDYQMLRQSRTGILSKENLGDMSLMFGRGGIDKPKRTKDEML